MTQSTSPAAPSSLRTRWAIAFTLLASLSACGGGGGSTSNSAPTPPPVAAPVQPPAPPLGILSVSACQPSGVVGATDYQVGDDKPLKTLEEVPWESLKAGDTVRIFYRATPYKSKFLIAAQGTETAPVRICGVRGPGNERPLIDGSGAITRPALNESYGSASLTEGRMVRDIHQARGIVIIKSTDYNSYPKHIQIDGLNFTRSHPQYSFTNAAGELKPYDAFGAAIWIERGHNITIADNEISDAQMGVFTRSSNDGDFAVTRDIRISGNHFWGHGIVDDVHMHTTYIQSVGVVIEGNRYGPLRTGASGNQLKDRSAGVVVRYNTFEGGAHSMDFVESEDGFQRVVKALDAYRSTLVYGNLIRNDSGARAIVHYGGDHFGGTTTSDNYGELNFRQGTLFFFNNTVFGTGSTGSIFRISTTLETVEAWNNIFWYEGTVNLRTGENDGVSPAWTKDGVLKLGVNWITQNWQLHDQYHPLQGSVSGTGNLITGATAPFDQTSLVLRAGSTAIDAGVAGPSAVSAYVVDYQLDSNFKPIARTINGSAIDLGALER